MNNGMSVAMLGNSSPYDRYALSPSYVNGRQAFLGGRQAFLGGYLMDQLQETGYTTTAEKDVSSMTSKEKANFFSNLLQKGADVAIAALNEKQAESNKAAEVAELERAKAIIAAGEGGKLTKTGNNGSLQEIMPFLIGGAAILIVGGFLISMNRKRRRR